jgi:HKD family nuclease
MSQKITLSGIGATHFEESLRQILDRAQPRVLGIAAAFVSVQGIEKLIILLRRYDAQCRLVAGTDNAITHPQALYKARDQGWRVRLGRAQRVRGIFHPKLLVAGDRFSPAGIVQELSCLYVGSSNLTDGGLKLNVECGFLANNDGCLQSGAEAFADIWNSALPATNAELRRYAAAFADRARNRPVSELSGLGINDTRKIALTSRDLLDEAPSSPAVSADFAIAAWTGLQSFTGQYRFQVEFPRFAGEVISRLIHGNARTGGRIQVYCPDDASTRTMQYKFYVDNSMFRLNVPNDVPGVDWARANHDGIAIVEIGLPGGAALRFRILKPGTEASEIVGRSATLGTWGKTSTRAYGWY